jgi:hypothetical protein
MARCLARLVLAWFVLSLGVAGASPIVHPQAMELICSGSGTIKVLVKTDEGVKEASGAMLDCPLCLVSGPPAPVPRTSVEPASPLAHVLRPVPAAHIAWLTASPLPARGPPAHS